MNDEGARQSALTAVPQNVVFECNASAERDKWPPVRHPEYARCDECGHVCPSAEQLDVHLIRRCCGLGRAA
jgi:hypothetical protein